MYFTYNYSSFFCYSLMLLGSNCVKSTPATFCKAITGPPTPKSIFYTIIYNHKTNNDEKRDSLLTHCLSFYCLTFYTGATSTNQHRYRCGGVAMNNTTGTLIRLQAIGLYETILRVAPNNSASGAFALFSNTTGSNTAYW
jgi:hypothetical protein